MGQVTIYLEDEIEQKMISAAKSANLSKSKWITKLVQEKISNEWPESVIQMAGSWQNFPSLADIRSTTGTDAKREKL